MAEPAGISRDSDLVRYWFHWLSSVLFCALAGADPFAVYASIYKAAFGSWYSFQNTLVRAAPLMLCSLGTAIPFQLGLGHDRERRGARHRRTLRDHGRTSNADRQSAHGQIVMAVVGMIAGGLWLAGAGALKHYRGVNETISSLMMNYIAIAILNQAINTWIAIRAV